MKATDKGSYTPSSVQMSYQLLRKITSPDEESTNVKSFVANFPASEILQLGTKDNLRGYIAEYNPKKRNRVHDAIRNTILTEPSRFITRNSGFVIAASDIEVDDNKKRLTLTDASIINGAQSQGEIHRWFKEYADGGDDSSSSSTDEIPFYVRAEIIVDPDAYEVVETAIARNTATPMKSITHVGAHGQLNELEASIQRILPTIKIRKEESEENVYDTRKILQYTRLLMPLSVSKNDSAAERLRAYKNPEQCLTDFSTWEEMKDTDNDAAAKYKFTVEIAPYAIQEYEYWEQHESWNGHRIWEQTKKGGRVCHRDRKTGKIKWVSPALIFPIMGAMSEFVVKTESGAWRIMKPNIFNPDKMIERTVRQFRGVNSDPILMGRNPGVYEALRTYPASQMEAIRDLSQSSISEVMPAS